jgi:hypothetical protein
VVVVGLKNAQRVLTDRDRREAEPSRAVAQGSFAYVLLIEETGVRASDDFDQGRGGVDMLTTVRRGLRCHCRVCFAEHG